MQGKAAGSTKGSKRTAAELDPVMINHLSDAALSATARLSKALRSEKNQGAHLLQRVYEIRDLAAKASDATHKLTEAINSNGWPQDATAAAAAAAAAASVAVAAADVYSASAYSIWAVKTTIGWSDAAAIAAAAAGTVKPEAEAAAAAVAAEAATRAAATAIRASVRTSTAKSQAKGNPDCPYKTWICNLMK